MAVTNHKNEPLYLIKGNLAGPKQTIFIQDLSHNELGRLFKSNSRLQKSYGIDVEGYPVCYLKHFPNAFYLQKRHLLITRNKDSFTFRRFAKVVASMKIIIDDPITLDCEIDDFEDAFFILLICVLLNKWKMTPLRLPDFPLKVIRA
ncbi:MAG: hypothetical protein Q3960_00760 [Lactobacillus sp.]|nr:hypothetical protein [Lactobacillus sp.]